jgi:hypothetical protein
MLDILISAPNSLSDSGSGHGRTSRPALADARARARISDIIYQSYFDQLLRVLLEFKSQPAVVILGAWSPQVAQDQGYGDPQIVHLPIAHYYDIPYIS